MDTNKTPIRHIPIFYATDEKYAAMAATSMASVLFNTDSFIDFYILDCNLSPLTRRKFEMLHERFSNFSIEFISVDSNEKFAHIELRCHLTLACFARLLIPDLKPNLGKVIYLDCDTIVMQDIAQLYEQNLDGFALGAVADPDTCNIPERRAKWYAAAQVSNTHLYFNSGILLLDCDVWRKNNMLPQVMHAERITATTRQFNDQDILNKTFDSNYKPLEIRFNVKKNLVTYCPQNEIVIRHFTGFPKPWMPYGVRQVNGGDFWFYCQMTMFFAETLIEGLSELKPINNYDAE